MSLSCFSFARGAGFLFLVLGIGVHFLLSGCTNQSKESKGIGFRPYITSHDQRYLNTLGHSNALLQYVAIDRALSENTHGCAERISNDIDDKLCIDLVLTATTSRTCFPETDLTVGYETFGIAGMYMIEIAQKESDHALALGYARCGLVVYTHVDQMWRHYEAEQTGTSLERRLLRFQGLRCLAGYYQFVYSNNDIPLVQDMGYDYRLLRLAIAEVDAEMNEIIDQDPYFMPDSAPHACLLETEKELELFELT